MTFTYSATDLSTDLAKVRFEVGDTIESEALFTDEEINAKLDGNSVLGAAADLCDVLATRYAALADTSVGGQDISLAKLSEAYAARAVALRDRSVDSRGLRSISTTRVDGYSDDITSSEVGGTNRRATFDRPLYDSDWT